MVEICLILHCILLMNSSFFGDSYSVIRYCELQQENWLFAYIAVLVIRI